MSQFLAIFIDEGREQIELLETGFLELEHENRRPDLVQDLFRAAHTLKGSSKAMGFAAMGDLTHRMEDVLDVLREGRLGSSTKLISTMLACVDLLKTLMDRIAVSGTDEVGESDHLAALLLQLGNLLEAGPVDSTSQLRLRVSFSEGCEYCGARALMVVAASEEVGSVLATEPDLDALGEDQFGSSFTLRIETTQDPQTVIKKLKGIPDVADVVVLRAEEDQKQDTIPTDTDKATVAHPSTSQTIRVDVNRLDVLLNLVGELVTDRTQMATLCGLLRARHHGDELVAHILEATTRIARVTGELQDEIMKTRMLPIDNVFQRMPRVIRDLAQKLGKKIKLDISGGDTEIDRSLIDALSDPLIHLLRNSVDHGIEDPSYRLSSGKPEEGTVTLRARHVENNIEIEITDDGQGIDAGRIRAKAVDTGLISDTAAQAMTEADVLKLIFAPGLSTATEVSDVSGRGVGMDIFRTNIEKIGGRVALESTRGVGTRFTIRLPLTLAIMRALLVEADSVTYALPLGSVIETLRLGSGEGAVKRERLSGRSAMVLRGETVPLSNLENLLAQSAKSRDKETVASDACVVVVGAGSGQIGFCVDSLMGEQEIVIKPLGSLLGEVHGISGASILGDGRVALIVDPARVMVRAA